MHTACVQGCLPAVAEILSVAPHLVNGWHASTLTNPPTNPPTNLSTNPPTNPPTNLSTILPTTSYGEQGGFSTQQPVLCAAVQSGQFACVDLLLARKADANARAFDGLNALMHAVRCSNLDMVTRLVRARASVNARSTTVIHDGKVHTAVSLAARNADPALLEFLLSRRGNATCARSNPLICAVHACLPANMRLLLRSGAKWTGAHRPSSGGRLQVHECTRLMTRVLDSWRARRQHLHRMAEVLKPPASTSASACASACASASAKQDMAALVLREDRDSLACLRVLRADTTYANRSVVRFFVWASQRISTRAISHETRLTKLCHSSPTSHTSPTSPTSPTVHTVHIPRDIVRLIAEFTGCNASNSSERDSINACIATQVLAAEVRHETPHPAAVPLLMKWGATALHTSAVRPYASDSALALIEDVMRRATDRVCPTRQAAARRARRVVEFKLLSQPKEDGSEGEDNVEVEGEDRDGEGGAGG